MNKIVFIVLPFIVFFYLGFKLLSSSVHTNYNFYHWKQRYIVESNDSNPPKYVKVLDISYEQGLKVFKTIFRTEAKSITAVIYLDNSLFLNIRANTLLKEVMKNLDELSLKSYNEIQVDCDWTGKTQKRYFEFLKLLKKKTDKKISTTIRLHQVKYYKKTGVPPVDYGVLMYYNMSDFKDIKTKNYILDLEIAKQYHYNFDTYPLPLNLALPLYSQATIIRFSKVIGFMEGVRVGELNDNFKQIKENLYKVTQTHYFKQKLLYEEDEIRIDEVSLEDLEESLKGLRRVMKQPKEIIFYRWGNRDFYGDENLSRLLQLWN
jgi:hypothetical protein